MSQPFGIADGASVINDARDPYLTRTFTGKVMCQHAIRAMVNATGLHFLYVNQSATSLTLEASCFIGWRSGGNLPQRITFGGVNQVTVSAYSAVLSDALPVTSISAGQFLYVRAYTVDQTATGGLACYVNYNPESITAVPVNTFGLKSVTGKATVSDATALLVADDAFEAAFVVDDHEQILVAPYALIGIPAGGSNPLINFVGDSKTAEIRDIPLDVLSLIRETLPGDDFPFQLLAIPGTDASTLVVGSSSLNLLTQSLLAIGGGSRAPVCVYRLGTNSLSNSLVPATATTTELGYVQSVISYCPSGTKLVVATIDPNTTKDGGADWTTVTEGQQHQSGDNSHGVDCPNYFNNVLRIAKPAYINEVGDTAGQVSTVSGFWLANMTNDGVHQTSAANVLQGPVLRAAINAALASIPDTSDQRGGFQGSGGFVN